MAVVILAWFHCMGVSVEQCFSWIEKSVTDKNLEIKGKLNAIKSKADEIARKPTLHPLPSYINVTLRLSSIGLRVFGISKEESLYTYQVNRSKK